MRCELRTVVGPDVIGKAPVIEAMLSALFVTKTRKPDAARQEWVLDECALLGGVDLVPKLFSNGAALGIRPWVIFQNPVQMDVLGQKARQIIMASAQVPRFYDIREPDTARLLSEMIGDQTLEIDDELVQGRADADRRKLWNAVMHGADPFAVVKELHQKSMRPLTSANSTAVSSLPMKSDTCRTTST